MAEWALRLKKWESKAPKVPRALLICCGVQLYYLAIITLPAQRNTTQHTTPQHNTPQQSCQVVPSGLGPLPAAHYEEEDLWPSYPCLFNGSPVKMPPSAPHRPRSHRVITAFVTRGGLCLRAPLPGCFVPRFGDGILSRAMRTWQGKLKRKDIDCDLIVWGCVHLCRVSAAPARFQSSPGAGCDLIWNISMLRSNKLIFFFSAINIFLGSYPPKSSYFLHLLQIRSCDTHHTSITTVWLRWCCTGSLGNTTEIIIYALKWKEQDKVKKKDVNMICVVHVWWSSALQRRAKSHF